MVIMMYFCNSDFENGGGMLKFSSPLTLELVASLKEALRVYNNARATKKLSKSDGDLRSPKSSDGDIGMIIIKMVYSV
jgi:hypothetical protein